MKKLYLFAIFLFGYGAFAQIIDFPDANFKARLLQPGTAFNELEDEIVIDLNGNGEIEVSETAGIFGLNVSNSNISDLTGISFFTSLKYLDCSYNSLSSLTIDDSVEIEILKASHNQLATVAVNMDESNNYGLWVDLSYNQLTSYAVEEAYYPDGFDLSHNQLSSLTINNAAFDYFYVNGNNLESIQVNGTATVTNQANFRDNNFTLLDLSNFSFAYEPVVFLGNNAEDRVVFGTGQPGYIDYSSNNSFLDLGNFSNITGCGSGDGGSLHVHDCPNLEYFNLKNGFNHTTVQCDEGEIINLMALMLVISNAPNLVYICTDEGEREYIEASVASLGLADQIRVNSYCSFSPGGSYSEVNGKTRFDTDSNGCDISDSAVAFQKFSVSDASEYGTVISNASGDYQIYSGQSTVTVTPVLENPQYFSVSPASATIDFAGNSSPVEQNFCIAPAGNHPDLEITIVALTPARPGFDADYWLVCRNKGNQVQSGTASFSFDDQVLDFVSSGISVSSNSGGVLTWDFTDLQPFETRKIAIVMNVNSPMETPAVNAGDVLSYSASIFSPQPDETPADNAATLHQTAVNSFDPNDIVCLEGEIVGPEVIGNYVHYRIRFENTGSSAAQNIVAAMDVDATKFDVSSLVPLGSSHSFWTRIDANRVEFVFENIELPFEDETSGGFVVFKIKTLPTLVVGDVFESSASIFFDYNFPIVTDPAVTEIQNLPNPDFEFGKHFRLYPNPATDSVTVESLGDATLKSVQVFDLFGRLVMTQSGSGNLPVSNLSSGIYFAKVISDRGSSAIKFVKE